MYKLTIVDTIKREVKETLSSDNAMSLVIAIEQRSHLTNVGYRVELCKLRKVFYNEIGISILKHEAFHELISTRNVTGKLKFYRVHVRDNIFNRSIFNKETAQN